MPDSDMRVYGDEVKSSPEEEAVECEENQPLLCRTTEPRAAITTSVPTGVDPTSCLRDLASAPLVTPSPHHVEPHCVSDRLAESERCCDDQIQNDSLECKPSKPVRFSLCSDDSSEDGQCDFSDPCEVGNEVQCGAECVGGNPAGTDTSGALQDDRRGTRLQGARHVFTIVPVNSGDLRAHLCQNEEQLPLIPTPTDTCPVSVTTATTIVVNNVPTPSSVTNTPTTVTFASTPPGATLTRTGTGVTASVPYNPYSTLRIPSSRALPSFNPYSAIMSPGASYNPYHTITGMLPSTYQRREYGVGGGTSLYPQREYGIGGLPLYHQRGDYGIGKPPQLHQGGVPASLVPVVLPRGSGTSPSRTRTGMHRVSTLPARYGPMGENLPLRQLCNPQSLLQPKGSPSLQPPMEQLTVHSLNQMTVQSSGGVSIEVGSADGHGLTVRGALTSPEQLPYLPAVFRHGHNDERASSRAGKHGMDARQTWANKAQFILACIGSAVGLGNLWRFPYLCYKSGGGAFLIPYFLMLFLCGIPLLMMELTIGQYTRRGPIGAMAKICPIFKGAGIGTVMMSFLLGTYYNVIIAWALFYLCQSFSSELPWSNCNTTWAINCFDDYGLNVTAPNGSKSASEEFFDEVVLQKSEGIHAMGSMRVQLLLALFAAWILVYFSLWKSIRSSGKVVYVTATLPYVLIGAFLWRALTLPGASRGLQYFFNPRWELLLEAQVWVNAAAQNFNSIGIAFGSLIAFSSYNKFNNNIVVDTWAISLTNSFTSLLAGMIVFSTLGNISYEQNKDIDEVVAQGPGLVFMVYPQALAKMPSANVWAILFFIMLLILGIDSQLATIEVIITSLQDGFPKWIRKYLKRHEILVLLVCIFSFLFGLPNIMQGGIYFFQLIDYYAAAVSLMYVAFFEVVAIVWIYGAGRLARNVREMTGRLPSFYFRFCWYIAAPLLILSIWVFSMVDYKEPTYNRGEYEYPAWAIGIGWMIAALSILPIPIFAVLAVVKAKGTNILEKFKNSIRSQLEECPCCGRVYNCLNEVHNTGGEFLENPVKLVVYNASLNGDDAKPNLNEFEKSEELKDTKINSKDPV